MELNKNTILKILGIISFAVILCVSLVNFGEVLKWLGFLWTVAFPFVLGGTIAFCVNIPMSFFEKKIFGNIVDSNKENRSTKIRKALARPISLFLTVVCILIVVAIIVVVLVPQLTATFESVRQTMIAFMPRAQAWLEMLFEGNTDIVEFIDSIEIDWGNILQNVKDFVFSGAGSVLSYTMNATVQAVNFVTTTFISVVFSIYILTQKETLARQFTRLLQAIFREKVVEKICYVAALSHRTFSRFITGQCLEACILGSMFFVAMLVFRFPYALLVGILIGVTSLIPIVGGFIGCFIGAFLILMVNPMQALLFVIMFLIIQQIEGNLIYPHVVGNSVGLPSMWVLFAVSVGGSLMGVVGMLIFIPLTSVFYSLLREWVNFRIREKENREESPTEEMREQEETPSENET